MIGYAFSEYNSIQHSNGIASPVSVVRVFIIQTREPVSSPV